jgi:protein-S-isoprenylcysteine O-methyltransferase Ste14
MRFHPAGHIIKSLWLILIIYWFISGFGNKKPKISQRGPWRLLFYIILIAATAYLLSPRRSHLPLFSVNAITQSIGILLCAAGVAFAIWARRTLGRNWSGMVMIKQDHELIQRGPYAVVRHPIYTGLILASAGSVLALIPTAAGFLAVLAWALAYYLKARYEERVLTGEFGEQYVEYKKRVRAALIPFVL